MSAMRPGRQWRADGRRGMREGLPGRPGAGPRLTPTLHARPRGGPRSRARKILAADVAPSVTIHPGWGRKGPRRGDLPGANKPRQRKKILRNQRSFVLHWLDLGDIIKKHGRWQGWAMFPLPSWSVFDLASRQIT